MPVLRDWDLSLDADRVLRGQGADPVVIRSRSPQLLDLAEKALAEAQAYLDPAVLYADLPVESLRHERINLLGGGYLQGGLIAQHMLGASRVIVMLCTIGPQLETLASQVMAQDMLYGLALDGVGSAATEALANAACHHFETQTMEAGDQATIPLSPGMVGWTVEQGQKQIFALLQGEQVGVTLTSSGVMVPRKSITLALGLGQELNSGGSTCDYCSMRETCRYQDHYV